MFEHKERIYGVFKLVENVLHFSSEIEQIYTYLHQTLIQMNLLTKHEHMHKF